jgi:hypothetical protein
MTRTSNLYRWINPNFRACIHNCFLYAPQFQNARLKQLKSLYRTVKENQRWHSLQYHHSHHFTVDRNWSKRVVAFQYKTWQFWVNVPHSLQKVLRIYIKNLKLNSTPWPQSESELYRSSDLRLSVKLVPTFDGRVATWSAWRIPTVVF